MNVIKSEAQNRLSLILFFVLVATVAMGNGFSDAIYANFFKDAYNVSAQQRAFIEFPRELPGILCVIIISALSFLGEIKIAFIAQILSFVGLTVLGLTTPSFSVMCVFLFINSMGMHLFMPLQDAIGMSLAEKGKVGKRVGQYTGVQVFFTLISGIIVFVGFRTGFFSFVTDIKSVFLIGSVFFAIGIVVSFLFIVTAKKNTTPQPKTKFRIVFKKAYIWYYLLTTLHGVQKQIAYVFGAWVLIDLLHKGADIMSLLVIVSSFLGIFFMQKLGNWIDSLGVKKMMYLDALSFIFIYLIYGFIVWGITDNVLEQTGWPVIVVYVLFVLDRLSMRIGVIKAVYLRSIALNESDIAPTLSTGLSLDHVVAIIAAQFSGLIWTYAGPQWVFFAAAFLSLGNLFVAWKVKT
ncbi:MAG: hypothetical protein R3Y36_03110 [Spirochaetales bacterium]